MHASTSLKKDKQPYIEHYIIECRKVDPRYLKKVADLEPLAKEFAERADLTVLKCFDYQFKPWGVSYVQIISESHAVYQTWPENGYLLIDLLSCKKLKSSSEIQAIAAEIFQTRDVKIRRISYD